MSEEPRWEVLLARQPRRILRRLPKDVLKRIDQKIISLAENPKPEGCKKLFGYDNLYRVRVGDWRIIYAIEDERLIVLILQVTPRGQAYRNI